MWFDHGGVFVEANLRGGAEYGESWHAGGSPLNKQNDMLRVELDPNGSFNVTEFGAVKDPALFKAMYATLRTTM